MGGIGRGGRVISLGDVEELCLLTEYVEGKPYVCDLEQIGATGIATAQDLTGADALRDFLPGIHHVREHKPGLYIRRIRELV